MATAQAAQFHPLPGHTGSLDSSGDKNALQETGGQIPHLSGPLSDLAVGWRSGRTAGRARAAARNVTLQNDQVHIQLHAQDTTSADALIQRAQEAGGRVSARYRQWVDIWLPAGELEDLAGQDGVVFIQQPIQASIPPELEAGPGTRLNGMTGTYITQGVEASNANTWHNAGITGNRVSIGILDSGFQDYTDAMAAGELPDDDLNILGELSTSTPHGTACAEIVHDMAPNAELTLASASTNVEFAQRVGELAEAGVQIISCSISFWGLDPGDGSGATSQAINDAYNDYGILFCKSAGNYALKHFDSYWRDEDSDGWLEIAESSTTEIIPFTYYLAAGYPIDLRLRWDDWPESDQNYDLYLYRWVSSSWELVAASTGVQDGSQAPFERISGYLEVAALFGVSIKKVSGSETNSLALMNMRYGEFYYNEPQRSLADEAAARWAYAVAAVDVDSLTREEYSSQGRAYGEGGAITGGINQPFLAGFANVDTMSYGSGLFNGTSSATPHIAGAAALVWSAYPKFNALQVRRFLNDRAKPVGSQVGYDNANGHGWLWLGNPDLPPGGLPILQLLLPPSVE